MAKARVTIRDVANVAGVSISTVSQALAGQPGVAERTRERVIKVAGELGFTPNRRASRLRTGEPDTISLILPDVANPFFAEMARGAEERAYERGYTLVLCNSNWNPSREEHYLEHAWSGHADGVVLNPSAAASASSSTLQSLLHNRFPVVVVDENIQFPANTTVLVDNLEGGRLAANHLLSIGCQRLAFIGGPAGLPTVQDRLRGFQLALHDHRLLPESRILFGEYLTSHGYMSMRSLIEQGEPPDGVFAASDVVAVGAIEALREAGWRVPSQVSIVGFDDSTLASLVVPRLTTIRQDARLLGARAAEALIDILDGRQPENPRVILDVELVVRESTRSLPDRKE